MLTLDHAKMIRTILQADHERAEELVADASSGAGLEALEGRGAALRTAILVVDVAVSDMMKRIAGALESLPPAPGSPEFQEAYVEQIRRAILALRSGKPSELAR